MGRSRGGLTTKIHALVDANGLPVVLKLTAGQAHDGRSAADMLGKIGEGQVLLADRAYDSDALRAEVKPAGIRVAIVEPGPVATNFNRLARNESHLILESPSAFHAVYERIRQDTADRWAASSEQVARVIFLAIRSAHPRARYRVRLWESLAAGVVSVVPRGAIDWLMIRFMGGHEERHA